MLRWKVVRKILSIVKSDINEILKGRKKSKSKNTIKNIKSLYESQEKVIKLFNDYSEIVSEAKCKIIYREGLPSDLACVAKIFDRRRLKILIPKQMLQKLPIALA